MEKNCSDVEVLKKRLLIPLTEAAAILGYKKQTAYNMKSKGIFPVAIKQVNGKPMVRSEDLLKFVAA
jgi:hypothetical protein